jgi:hypothetical protein
MPDGEGDRGTTALAVAGGGLAAFLLGWIFGRGWLRLLGLAAAAAGGALYARGKLSERGQKIEEAESRIREELDDLDPVARAQVLKDVARSQL